MNRRGAVETVGGHELVERRRRLLARTGTSRADLKERAGTYALSDDERSIYDGIRSINWMLSRVEGEVRE